MFWGVSSIFQDYTTARPMAPSNRLQELDALRGVAALGVLACHFTSQCHKFGLLPFEFRWGSYGPHLFFIISGFVILMTLERCKRPIDFLYSRFSRLYPLYWMSVLISATILIRLQSSESGVPTPLQIAANLTMLQTWLRVPDIEVSYWTLGVELKFYVIMFLLYISGRLNRVELFSAAWLATILVFRLVETTHGPLPRMAATPLIVDYAHLFIAGLMTYRIFKLGASWKRCLLFAFALPFQYVAQGAESACMVAIFLAAFSAFLAGRLGWINQPSLIFMGTISYALYLVHGAVGSATMHWLHAEGQSVVLMLVLPSAASILLASLLTFGFERPCLQVLRNRGKRANTQVVGAI
jgi:peptidoglycan/LPS O-acetylase OafA/YrhL